MEILIMQVFVSLLLGAGSVLLFLYTARQRDFEHADRLALLPVEPDDDDLDEVVGLHANDRVSVDGVHGGPAKAGTE